MKNRKRWILWTLLIIIVIFFLWRFLRPLNIFVVDDKFAYPIETAVPEGLDSLRASECGECHKEIYKEWSQSIHAQAWTEEYFVADRKFENNPDVCDNCHIQLAQQRPYKVVGFKDSDRLHPIKEKNPDYDPELQNEAITCAVCHVRDGKIIGPYETDLAPHPVKVDASFLSGMSPCKICHVVSGDRWDMFYDKPPCGTEAEIREQGIEPDCVGCHLPRVTRPMATGGPVRTGGKHLFQGGHTPAQVKRALDVKVKKKLKEDGWLFTVTLTNVGAHHYVPTGTPDRHLTIHWRLKNAKGEVLDSEQEEKLKRTMMWRPFIVELWDKRLPFNKPRHYDYHVAHDDYPQATSLELEVRYHLLEESRRKRIGYKNTIPINYSVYKEQIPLQ
ncbi:multiheme c-type cytochrome [Magnetococcales bacterium HHB-1]